MAVKYDGIIEAVRYAPNGKIELVRAYERRGAAFSDRVVLDRQTLAQRLKKGEKFIVGQRRLLLAGTFQTAKSVQMLGEVISTAPKAGRDLLEEVPLF